MSASNEAASNETGPASEPAGTGPLKLHRNLSVWEAIGISLALMAPSMAASINPQGTATTVGRAVPIAFALAFVGGAAGRLHVRPADPALSTTPGRCTGSWARPSARGPEWSPAGR